MRKNLFRGNIKFWVPMCEKLVTRVTQISSEHRFSPTFLRGIIPGISKNQVPVSSQEQ